MIPQSFIQDLLARVDIVDLVERYVPLKKKGANYFGRCPFHDEKSASFSVSPNKQFYHCFGCGAHGTALGFVMEHTGIGFIDAVKELAQQQGMVVPQESGNTSEKTGSRDDGDLFKLMTQASAYYQKELSKHARASEYVKQRGLSPEIIAAYGIGYAPDDWQALAKPVTNYQHPSLATAGLVIDKEAGRRYDRFRDRIMFPIHDQRGRIIAFGGRIIDAGEPKYLNSPETPIFNKSAELYGLHLARDAARKSGFIIVVEGYMDVLALAQFGLANAVATLGTASNTQHIKRLFRVCDEIVFCFDGDAAGRRAAWRALENSVSELKDHTSARFLFLPAEHDPDSFVREVGEAQFNELARQAKPLFSFMFDELSADLNLYSEEGRAKLVHRAKPLLQKTVARLLLLQALQTLAKLSQMDNDTLIAMLELGHRFKGNERQRQRYIPRNRQIESSMLKRLAQLVLKQPARSAGLPLALLADGDDYAECILAVHDAFMVGQISADSAMGSVVEAFRNHPQFETLRRLVSECEDSQDNQHDDTLFTDLLAALCIPRQEPIMERIRHFEETQKTRSLSDAERQELNDLMIQLAQRKTPQKSDQSNN